MSKVEFLKELEKGLWQLDKEERKERIKFYAEMIEDLIEEGNSEEQAIEKIGDTKKIILQILEESENKKPRTAWKNTLLIAGSPIWFVFLASAFVVVISLYASFFAVVVSSWAVFGSLVGAGVGGLIMFVATSSTLLQSLALAGACIFAVGLSIVVFFGAKWLTKQLIFVGSKTVEVIKNAFVKGGNKND